MTEITTHDAEPERAVVVASLAPGTDGETDLAEMRELLRTARVDAVATLVQHRRRPDPRTYLGPGKLDELRDLAGQVEAEVIVSDDELTPRQQRTLEDALQMRVVDRTAVILDIFAQHAHTAEGKLQVELAQLEYSLARMRGMWKHLERLGGGVGTRGPGETQLESDRRMARRRLALLRSRLREVAARRGVMRQKRSRSAMPAVALAGYTNVGKSTLLNALTGSEVSVDDRLFETLDPTIRAFREDGRAYLVTDTVGFIGKLPHTLVEAFAATLEETLAGDLVLLVADASSGEDGLQRQLEEVRAVLADIGADELPQLLVINKIDAVDALTVRRLQNRFADAVLISARTGENLDELKRRIAEFFSGRYVDVRLLVPHAQGGELSALYATGAPITAREDGAEGVLVTARLPREMVGRFAAYRV
ncbi:MAG TPA: GTPase HflX, partial [Acidimicrobiales bacterium]|nr:GTPase HflX [Acidimicrobiales bacterium]